MPSITKISTGRNGSLVVALRCKKSNWLSLNVRNWL
jgi:hypothetical protein